MYFVLFFNRINSKVIIYKDKEGGWRVNSVLVLKNEIDNW